MSGTARTLLTDSGSMGVAVRSSGVVVLICVFRSVPCRLTTPSWPVHVVPPSVLSKSVSVPGA